jgi:CheY-like chemotaxis protein
MPWLDGRETARRLRRPGATPGQPWIIGLSAHAGREEADTAIAAGMDRFLTKPVSFADLSAAVAEAPGARARPTSAAASPGANPALAQRLAQQFFAETPAIVADMRTALANHDWLRLRSRAHYLKNSADVLGADELRRVCNALYLNADSAEADRLHELVAAVEAASCSSSVTAEFSPDPPAQP